MRCNYLLLRLRIDHVKLLVQIANRKRFDFCFLSFTFIEKEHHLCCIACTCQLVFPITHQCHLLFRCCLTIIEIYYSAWKHSIAQQIALEYRNQSICFNRIHCRPIIRSWIDLTTCISETPIHLHRMLHLCEWIELWDERWCILFLTQVRPIRRMIYTHF